MFRGVLLAAALLTVAWSPGAVAADAAPVKETTYYWTRVTTRAALPGGSNFPVFVSGVRAYAMHPDGTYSSTDGGAWRAERLPDSNLNTAYLKYVQLGEEVLALGTMKGGHVDFVIDPTIRKTTDFKKWEVAGVSETLPRRIFYAAVNFQGAIWMLGGDDGTGAKNDIWRSTDGLNWTQVVTNAPWSPRTGATAFVFKDQLWLIGGAGPSGLANDVWSSVDGLQWVQATPQIATWNPFGFTPVVFDNRIWLFGADSTADDAGEMLVSEDGARWRRAVAPWTPRTGSSLWVMEGGLFMAGGSYTRGSDMDGASTYSREVWRMER